MTYAWLQEIKTEIAIPFLVLAYLAVRVLLVNVEKGNLKLCITIGKSDVIIQNRNTHIQQERGKIPPDGE